jgi:diguanylate cyclase (GGDEF)-like protein/PAS domain S-box-containing protein
VIRGLPQSLGRPAAGTQIGARLRERFAGGGAGPGHPATPLLSGLERGIARARLGVAGALALVLVVHHAPHIAPALLAVASLALASAAVLHPWTAARLPRRLLSAHTLFGVEADAAFALALAFPAPDVLSWLPFVALIVAGAARWTVNGAALAYVLYLAADLPATLHVPGGPLSGAAGIRVGVIGLTSTIAGVLARSIVQFRSLQARTAELDASLRALRAIEKRKEVQAAVARVFVESASLEGGVEGFLQAMCTGFGWQGGQLWAADLADASGPTLQLTSSWYGDGVDGTGLAALSGGLRLTRGQALPGLTWERCAVVAMPLTEEASAHRQKAFAHSGLSDGLAFPIVTDGGVIGVAEFFAHAPIDVDGIADTLSSVGAHCGLFVERRQEEAAHRETAMRLQSLLDNVSDGIITFDERGTIESANHGAAVLFGCTAEELTRTTVDMLLAQKQRRGIAARLERGAMEWETEGLRRDGSTFPMDFRSSEMRIGGTRLFIATLRDTSELKARTLALQHQALHDNLTGLPNRTLLTDRLGQAINRAARAGRPAALLLMDMDGFKEVNDTLGHHSGDALLRQVADRLRGTLRAEDTVARLGGDEFAILPAGACDEAAAMRVAQKVLTALHAPFYIDEQAIHARMSIGVAVYPTHGQDADTLMRRADVAMYTAKRMRSGRASYSPAQDEHSKRRLQLTGELRRAIPASELVLHYQPRLHLPTNTITALEALVRWQHPTKGLVPPAEFIPVAEQSDLIHPLTAWVAGEAVRQLRAFQELGLDLDVAINISARNLADQQLPAMMASLLHTWGVGASKLRLEMTESVVMASDWQEVLTQLHQLGLSVAIDDFGVGYSSLAYLQRLPVDEIKIDRSFVGDMVDNPDNAAIVRSTIELGHNLGLKVVAEGVETEECLRMLGAFGCDSAQGFLVSKPLAAGELVEFFAARDAAGLALRRSA